jgi:hypothetical protein
VLLKKSKLKSKLLPPKNRLAIFLLKTNAWCPKTGGIFNVKEQLLTELHGKLYRLACQKAISWNNRYCHSTTSVHVDKKAKYSKALDDFKMGGKICRARISAEALTGINYEEGWNGNTFMWVRALFAGNVSLSGFLNMKVCDCLLNDTWIAPYWINSLLCQLFLGPLVNGHVPNHLEMSERITDVVAWHNSEIAKSIADSFSQYALIMDGSPLFAETECIIHRSIDKDLWKIKELAVDVGLFKKSLNA